mmetsp:Transcript_72515/g.125810  ORF Transcript_72515/g.125810 Transcript_72515/m.125810 type:complete len:345 (-) Transcript_72515:126-1160(-)
MRHVPAALVPEDGSRSSVAAGVQHRVAVLGQKDALIRVLYELGHLKRTHALEVLVIAPPPPKCELLGGSAHTRGVCEAFEFGFVETISAQVVLTELQAFQPDLLVSVLWPRRIQDNVLALCADCINFHPSLLPRHRGSLTQFWAVFEGDQEAGTTCHRMVHDFDAGRILDQEAVPLVVDETALSLSRKIAMAIEHCFKRVIRAFLQSGALPRGRQWNVDEFPYHFKKIPRGGVIDPTWPDDKVDRFIRAMYFPPHPPAMALDADGCEKPVTMMEAYVSLRKGMSAVSNSSAAAVLGCSSEGPAPRISSAKRKTQPWLVGAAAAAALGIVVPLLAVRTWRSRHTT